MGVSIQRHGNGIVSKELLNDLWVDASPQKQRGARMPEIMEADLRETRLPQQRLEGTLYEILGVEGRPVLGREDQAVIFVKVGESHPVLQLPPAVRLESRHRPRRKVDPPPAPLGLGLAHDVTATLSHESAPHTQCASIQVRIVPAKPQQLPTP